MRPAPFAQVLDDTIAAFAVADTAAPRATFKPAPVLGFFDLSPKSAERPPVSPFRPAGSAPRNPAYGSAPRNLGSGLDADAAPHSTVVGPVPRSGPAGTPPRPARKLSFRHRVAFEQLVNLGAAIAPDFTREELRHAFRDLAHRYHPDRHQGSAAAEQARLADLFRRAHDAYRVLKLADAA